MRECEWCGKTIVYKNAQAKYCSSKCRVYAHRTTIPRQLTEQNRWMRYTTNKRPVTIDGRAASSTDPETWASYQSAKASTAGPGIGFALGDGIGCIDLDHCLVDGEPTEPARQYLETYSGHYIEVSPSGNGLHIWGTAEPATGWRKTIDGLQIERYTTGRYITVTGNIYQRGSLLPL